MKNNAKQTQIKGKKQQQKKNKKTYKNTSHGANIVHNRLYIWPRKPTGQCCLAIYDKYTLKQQINLKHLNFSNLRPRTWMHIVSDINLELFVRTSGTSKPYRLEQYKTLCPISEKLSSNLILWLATYLTRLDVWDRHVLFHFPQNMPVSTMVQSAITEAKSKLIRTGIRESGRRLLLLHQWIRCHTPFPMSRYETVQHVLVCTNLRTISL